jgi:hypothetical protein
VPLRLVTEAASTLSRALADKDRLDRFKNDEEIERDRHMLDVEQLVLKLLKGVLDARSVFVANLSPPS